MPFDNPEAFVGVELNDVTLRLIAGRQRIENGWVQKEYEENGSYCALGALGFDDDRDWGQLRYAPDYNCAELLFKSIPTNQLSGVEYLTMLEQITIYNDDVDRDQSEILELFDRAIADSMNCG